MNQIWWYSSKPVPTLNQTNATYLWVQFSENDFDLLVIEIGALKVDSKTIFSNVQKHSFFKGNVKLKIIGQPVLIEKIVNEAKISNYSVITAKEKVGSFSLKFSLMDGRIQISKSEESDNKTSEKIKVLIVDDSSTIRNLLTVILAKDPQIQIVAAAAHAGEVEALIEKFQPQVLTVDIHMPEKDGVQLIKEIVPKYKLPCIVISSISMEEGPKILEALEAGAVDYFQKPSMKDLDVLAPVMIERVKSAAMSKVKNQTMAVKTKSIATKPLNMNSIVLIGSSTGGTEALRAIFESLPSHIPPIVVVQHIPPIFSKALADRLNQLCPFEVKEAQANDEVLPNRILIAPGGKQLKLVQQGARVFCEINDDPPMNRHKPSVDYMFQSATKLVGKNLQAVILTGMGADGAKQIKSLRDMGYPTIAQDKDSCVVFGMPRAAIELDGASHVLTLTKISQKILDLAAEEYKERKVS